MPPKEAGPVRGTVLPPVTVPPAVDSPVSGLNHSTVKLPEVPERFTVTVPPVGRNTRYSLPTTARQYAPSGGCPAIVARSPRGSAWARSIRNANDLAYPMFVRIASHFRLFGS